VNKDDYVFVLPYFISPQNESHRISLSTGKLKLLLLKYWYRILKKLQLRLKLNNISEEWVKRAKNLDAKYIACERAFVYYGSSMFY